MSLVTSPRPTRLRGPPKGAAGTGLAPTVASLHGALDLSTVPALCETLSGAIAFGGADLILDLSAVEFLDASTVGVIVAAGEFLRARSRSLVLRSPSRCAQRVLDMCGLSGLVERDSRDSVGALPFSRMAWPSQAPR
jgi:anti-sigma B factor antagonist